MSRDDAIAAYWAAKNHAEEHAAYQWLIRYGLADEGAELCPGCAERFATATREVARG